MCQLRRFIFGAEQGGRNLNKRRKNEGNKPLNKKDLKVSFVAQSNENEKKNENSLINMGKISKQQIKNSYITNFLF